ncbi:uncharacterized protein LOC129249967 [Anastrepha obliqua]|uniref:uncharacterized protein LOC129249967 n=1 Tax=Anastrepha obliqua TaxID=95512 RepID=UPI0024092D52|nr:uncharacterized protein LOC129249967 [Anastrepha obliqua]
MEIRTITNVSTAKSQHYNSHNNIDSNNKKDRPIRKSNSAKMPTIKLGQHKKRSLMHARFVGVEINGWNLEQCLFWNFWQTIMFFLMKLGGDVSEVLRNTIYNFKLIGK